MLHRPARQLLYVTGRDWQHDKSIRQYRSTAIPGRSVKSRVGGWGSNPRPADYENYGDGPVHADHGGHRMPATERYRLPADQRMPAPGGIRPLGRAKRR